MDCDVLIIGAGQAATPLAMALAAAGRSVCVAESRHLGGSCVNFGCTPSKAAFASAALVQRARTAAALGVRIPQVEVDFPEVLRRARSFAEKGRQALQEAFDKRENPRLLRGHARLLEKGPAGFLAEVGEQSVRAQEVVLDCGTRSSLPPIEGLDRLEPLTAETWLDGRALPRHLAIIGGGYIGLEMAQFYRRMGAAVTVIESSGSIAGQEDEDVAACLQALLEGEGIAFRLGTRARRVEAADGGLRIDLDGEAAERLEASDLFVATGRTPNSDGLGLETLDVELDEDGYLVVDQRLATSCPGLWAAGDLRGGPMFTQTAWDDYRILESQLLGDGKRTLARIVPYAVFTEPQLGRVGLTETQAREQGHGVRVARFEMSSNGKAREIGRAEGMIKVVVGEDDRILGAAVLAAEGAELVHIYGAVMAAGASFRVIADSLHIHPTLAEAVQSALGELGDRS